MVRIRVGPNPESGLAFRAQTLAPLQVNPINRPPEEEDRGFMGTLQDITSVVQNPLVNLAALGISKLGQDSPEDLRGQAVDAFVQPGMQGPAGGAAGLVGLGGAGGPMMQQGGSPLPGSPISGFQENAFRGMPPPSTAPPIRGGTTAFQVGQVANQAIDPATTAQAEQLAFGGGPKPVPEIVPAPVVDEQEVARRPMLGQAIAQQTGNLDEPDDEQVWKLFEGLAQQEGMTPQIAKLTRERMEETGMSPALGMELIQNGKGNLDEALALQFRSLTDTQRAALALEMGIKNDDRIFSLLSAQEEDSTWPDIAKVLGWKWPSKSSKQSLLNLWVKGRGVGLEEQKQGAARGFKDREVKSRESTAKSLIDRRAEQNKVSRADVKLKGQQTKTSAALERKRDRHKQRGGRGSGAGGSGSFEPVKATAEPSEPKTQAELDERGLDVLGMGIPEPFPRVVVTPNGARYTRKQLIALRKLARSKVDRSTRASLAKERDIRSEGVQARIEEQNRKKERARIIKEARDSAKDEQAKRSKVVGATAKSIIEGAKARSKRKVAAIKAEKSTKQSDKDDVSAEIKAITANIVKLTAKTTSKKASATERSSARTALSAANRMKAAKIKKRDALSKRISELDKQIGQP